jgi:hypothetical protein
MIYIYIYIYAFFTHLRGRKNGAGIGHVSPLIIKRRRKKINVKIKNKKYKVFCLFTLSNFFFLIPLAPFFLLSLQLVSSHL